MKNQAKNDTANHEPGALPAVPSPASATTSATRNELGHNPRDPANRNARADEVTRGDDSRDTRRANSRIPKMGDVVIIRNVDDGSTAPAIVNKVDVVERLTRTGPDTSLAFNSSNAVNVERYDQRVDPRVDERGDKLDADGRRNDYNRREYESCVISATMFPAGQNVRFVDNVVFGEHDVRPAGGTASRFDHRLVAHFPSDETTREDFRSEKEGVTALYPQTTQV